MGASNKMITKEEILRRLKILAEHMHPDKVYNVTYKFENREYSINFNKKLIQSIDNWVSAEVTMNVANGIWRQLK